ncbi:MAG TPA: hypothetical protein VHE08_03905 [Solirubrobacterales bacterium]|nr:hypothetical protein [Solirubrobacterales bacterium]
MNLEALAARAAALGGDRRLRLIVALLGFAAITAATALIAHPKMFTGFVAYDDEGYMLTALKSFVNHGHLYDQVFSQYGPFYYEFWGGFFSLFGIAVTHDSGRSVVMVLWVLSSLVFGLSILRITGSILLGLGTQILTFSALEVLTNEPMHPVSSIALLLALIVAISTFVGTGRSRWAMGLLGAAVAALVLTKINVGFFAFVSVALACAVSYQQLWGRRWPRLLVELVFLAVPVLLLASKFDEGWARHYSVHVFATALAVVIALRAREPVRRHVGELRWLLGGFVVLVVASCVAILATGTSIHGLIDGVIGQPLRQSDAFTIPMLLSRREYAFDLLAVGAALAYWYASRRRAAPSPAWLALGSVFAIVVGLTMAFSMVGQLLPFNDRNLTGYQLSMLPFVWVALAATTAGEEDGRFAFARLLLPLLAVLQGLHGYPVAGSQTLLSVVLVVPVGALCVANGVRGLALLVEVEPDRLALAGFGVLMTAVLAWFVLKTYVRDPLHQARGVYHTTYQLHLPGSEDMHLFSEEEVQLYEAVSQAMRENCRSTVMEPGMDSFYLWTEEEPPSLTATGWETLFDDEAQEQVIEDTAATEGLCLLRNKERAGGWGEREGPLVTYLEHGFRPIGKWEEYELLRRQGPAPSPTS